MFLKRYFYGLLYKLFGDKGMVENIPVEELYDETKHSLSYFHIYVINSFIAPSGLFIIVYLVNIVWSL